jgi:hypothetical protein
MLMRRTCKSAVVPLAMLVALAGCAGYQVGNWSLYPDHIDTVYVPIFQSQSFRRNLGEWLTEAVVKEIESKTPYKVVSTPNADSALIGEILGDVKHVQVKTNQNDPRALQYEMVVRVRWEDRRGQMIRQCPPIPLPPAAMGLDGTSTLVPEFGQSVATAQQDAIRRIAREIVGMMEVPW